MDSELRQRLERIYAAAQEAFSIDPVKVRQELREERDGRWRVGVVFDDSFTEEQKYNQVQAVIYNTAHLRDHLKRKAKSLGFDSSEVDDVVENSTALQLVIDLSNRDKHGPARDGGLSGRSPELKNLVVAFVGGWSKGDRGSLEVTIGPGLDQEISLGGTGHFEIVGKVVDDAGQVISGIRDLLLTALDDWSTFVGLPGFVWVTSASHDPLTPAG